MKILKIILSIVGILLIIVAYLFFKPYSVIIFILNLIMCILPIIGILYGLKKQNIFLIELFIGITITMFIFLIKFFVSIV